MQTIVLASGNRGKLDEIQSLLGADHFDVRRQSEYDVPEADEIGLTFVENAIIKARNACAHTKLPAIADDSGIEVDALNGKPGIYSARFAGLPSDDKANNLKLLNDLQGVIPAERTARYQCVLVYMRHHEDPTPIICSASWEGHILESPMGDGGFGYDPLFFLNELNCTAAQLEKSHKNQISHRGQALRSLVEALRA